MVETQSRRLQARGVARRKKLIDSAQELLCSMDYADVTFAAISSHAGVPEGSAYHFFSNRQAIFQEIERQKKCQGKHRHCNQRRAERH